MRGGAVQRFPCVPTSRASLVKPAHTRRSHALAGPVPVESTQQPPQRLSVWTSEPGKVINSVTTSSLRQAAAAAFPAIPPHLWKNSCYIQHKHPVTGSPAKIPVQDLPKPRARARRAALAGQLSSFKRPPPGLDFLTVELDRKVFQAARHPSSFRRALRIYFALCTTATDVLHIVALAVQRKVTAATLPLMHSHIIQALFRSRDRVSDQRICSVLRMVIKRLQLAGLPVPYELSSCGLKFAARSRQLDKFRWFLVHFRRRDLPMSRNLFRSVIAKCGIGHRGFGQIRNGKWDIEQLKQALFGFEHAGTAAERHAHLEAWLERGDWQEVHAWMQILSAVNATDRAKVEWAAWRNGTGGRSLRAPPPSDQVKAWNARNRADSFFLRMMLGFNDLAMAWEVFITNPRVWTLLDDQVRHALISYGETQCGAMERLKSAMSSATDGRDVVLD